MKIHTLYSSLVKTMLLLVPWQYLQDGGNFACYFSHTVCDSETRIEEEKKKRETHFSKVKEKITFFLYFFNYIQRKVQSLSLTIKTIPQFSQLLFTKSSSIYIYVFLSVCLWTKNEPLNFSPQKLALGSHAGDPWFDPQLDPFAKKAYYFMM